ncbi:type I-E CRISPR-associated protein Cas6/Cse3/CasE [Oceanospirillum maris]|uniref:type I-E CRISPR-associated protein Cas6/Cse3/CasE n=1 Tax=Oceanospirillum maris TaxID=64977 RepID=UPI0003F8B0BC|nr:type I-E CRISPR-associated protein Cas6/Cse3/CasE [Oceanospirillum maris]
MFLSRVKLKPDIGRNSQLGRLLTDRTYGTHRLLYDLFDAQGIDGRHFLYREEIAKEQLGHRSGARGEPLYYLLSAEEPKSETALFLAESKPFKPGFQQGQRLAFKVRVNPTVSKQGKRHDLVMDEQICFYQQISQSLGLPVLANKQALKQQLLAKQETLVVWLQDYLGSSRYFACLQQNLRVDALLKIALEHAVSKRLQSWLCDNPSRAGCFSIAECTIEDDILDREFEVPIFEYYGYQAHPIPEKNRGARFCSVDLSGELIVNAPEQFSSLLQKGIGSAKGFGCGLMLVKPVSQFF